MLKESPQNTMFCDSFETIAKNQFFCNDSYNLQFCYSEKFTMATVDIILTLRMNHYCCQNTTIETFLE